MTIPSDVHYRLSEGEDYLYGYYYWPDVADPVPFSEDLELYIPSIGELVINSDTRTVHVGDGQKLGGHPAS